MADADANFDALNELGIKLVGASADALEGAQETVDEGHPYPIAYGLDADDAQALGAWTGVRQGHTILNPVEFVLNPDGQIMVFEFESLSGRSTAPDLDSGNDSMPVSQQLTTSLHC